MPETLQPGTTLAGGYEVERQLGAGATSTVYLARDLRHHRAVAVKVLHPDLSAIVGPDRFLREIELTAKLQHPHVLPLFDSGAADGLLYYVMPCVDGETLRSRLERERQLPIEDALRIATEVADALSYAHGQGIIHRDVKPENILLQGGHALVADFGIALALERAGGARLTQTGLGLGTPQYMAPEQATGEPIVDGRADVYALGAVTYEMLVGQPPFTGPTAQAIVAMVLTENPPSIIARRHHVPPHVENAVLTALEKLPADRFAGPAAFAAALAGPLPRGAPARARKLRRRLGTHWALAPTVGLAALGAGLWLGARMLAPPSPPLAFGRAARVTWEPGLEVQPAISPNGRSVAYAGGNSTDTRIYVRDIGGGRANRLTDDSAEVETNPGWSPDGSRVLFVARGAVFSAPSAGGPARQEVPAVPGHAVTSAAWAPDGRTIAYTVGDSVLVHAADGRSRTIARLPEPTFCSWSPDAAFLACTSGNARYLTLGTDFGNLSPNRIVVCRLRDGTATTVSDSTSINVSPVWSRDGRWLYYVSNRDGRGDIYAQRVDRAGRARGQRVRLTVALGAQSISLSADGSRLAYSIFSPAANLWTLPLPTGRPTSTAAATPLTSGDQVIENASVSRDGRWLVYDSDVSGRSSIYRLPLSGGVPTGPPERLTTDSADDFSAELSPDDQELAFHSWRTGSRDIWVLPLDGRPVQHVTSAPGHEWVPTWAPDGRAIAYLAGTEARSVEIVRRGPDGSWGASTTRVPLGFWPAWSPDGRWIAFTTRLRDGSLAVVPVAPGPQRVLVDAGRPGTPVAERPQWSPDSRTLYFKSHDAHGTASIWSVPFTGGAPTLLVRFEDPTRPSYRPQWAFGNGRAYFPVEDRQADIWVIDLTGR